jgi:hypothetical protein
MQTPSTKSIHLGVTAAVILVSLVGCNLPPIATEDQLAIARVREYSDVSERQMREAVTNVFAASRPGEYEMVSTTNGMRARHAWQDFALVTVVAGSEVWEIHWSPRGRGLVVSASRKLATGDFAPVVDVGSFDEASAYNLFYARLDFALGKRSDWVSCEQYKQLMLDPRTPKTNEQTMCGKDATDQPAQRTMP